MFFRIKGTVELLLLFNFFFLIELTDWYICICVAFIGFHNT